MRVLVLTPYQYGRVPGPRSSFELWESKVLKPAGIELVYSSFETDGLREVIYEPGQVAGKVLQLGRAYTGQALRVRRAKDYDAVLVNREAALIGPALLERWVVAQGVPLIYHLDDPLYIPYKSPFNGYLSYLKFFGKVGALCRMSSVVIANSTQIVEYASRYSPNVVRIPSVVDGDTYYPAAANGNPAAKPCVGWSGSDSTVANLLEIEEPMRELVTRCDVDVRLIGAGESPWRDVPATVQPWRAETEVEDLRRLDVGLLPLPHNEWNKRKFFLKLVQYMALGIPAVCTPLGSAPEVVEDGVNGFLARDRDEWVRKLELLATDDELRQEMAEKAAAVAAQQFTVQANAEQVVAAFRRALS